MTLRTLKSHIDAWIQNIQVDPDAEVCVEVRLGQRTMIEVPLVETDLRLLDNSKVLKRVVLTLQY